MTTPTDGEWMSAQEALDCLGLDFANAAHAICAHAFAELVQAKARRFLVHGTPAEDDVELPREFWSRSEEATWHDWRTGHFETTFDDRRFEAFGVQFRHPDIEQLKPAIAASSNAPLSPRQRPVGRTVFIGHGHSREWLELEKFLRDRLRLAVLEFNSVSAAGVQTGDRLKEMLGQADSRS
jgi:hypothetical protein